MRRDGTCSLCPVTVTVNCAFLYATGPDEDIFLISDQFLILKIVTEKKMLRATLSYN